MGASGKASMNACRRESPERMMETAQKLVGYSTPQYVPQGVWMSTSLAGSWQ